MAWDRRTFAALAAFPAAHLAMLSCNGAEFTASDSAAGGSSGSSGSSSSSAGKASSAGSNQGGKTSPGGSTSGGSPAGGTPGTAGGAGADPGAGGDGVVVQPGFELPPEGLLYWFTADEGVEAEAEGVTTWKDRSGNGFNAFQLIAEMRPTLTTSNLRPLTFLNFDGQDDYLELPELESGLSDGISLFVVAGSSPMTSCSAFLELSNGPEINDVNFGADEGALQYEVDQAVLTGLEGTFPVGDLRLAEVHHSGSADLAPVELRVNGVQAGSTVMPLPTDVPRISNFLGRTLYANCTTFSGAMAELILYSRKVTADERTSIEGYLADKWQCCN